jgi:hypothetical protein
MAIFFFKLSKIPLLDSLALFFLLLGGKNSPQKNLAQELRKFLWMLLLYELGFLSLRSHYSSSKLLVSAD